MQIIWYSWKQRFDHLVATCGVFLFYNIVHKYSCLYSRVRMEKVVVENNSVAFVRVTEIDAAAVWLILKL